MAKYFGTDGIRGKAYEKLNSELAFKLGQAIAIQLKPKQVVMGMDTRESSPMIAYSLANGLQALGVDILFAGIVPTPVIAHYSYHNQMIGVMITASHNPYHDNGIKVFDKGYKTREELELKLEAFIDLNELSFTHFGSFKPTDEPIQLYKDIYCNLKLHKSNFKIGIDSAHGSNYRIAKDIFDTYHPLSMQTGNEPNGKNINFLCGSTHLESIIKFVKDNHLDIGFSFDGDGDRMLTVDHEGRIYDGDQIIYLIGNYLKSKGLLSHNKVVLSKMSNPGILEALKRQGIDYVLTDVGDKYIFHEILTHGYTIGGESSGHIILNHLLHTGDGLLSAIYLLEILTELNTSLAELIKDVTLFPYQLTNIKDIDKSILKRDHIIKFLDDIKNQLGQSSLMLVRPSGTENLIRITISHKEQNIVDQVTQSIVDRLRKEALNS
ncbi:MAG: hypothetical protein WC992_08170 [Acholeplasmataceae bacterium]|jgi:phosphoglucosamine mutase